jgi:hypothetical protein
MLSVRAGQIEKLAVLYEHHRMPLLNFFVRPTAKSGKNPRQPTVEDGRKEGGKYRIVFDKGVVGSINGGGAEIQFKTVNGSIHARKGK